MPDLQPVYAELRRRLAPFEGAFVTSHDLTDVPDLTLRGREPYAERGRPAP